MTHTERALLTESVHDTLREQIFSGELPPGTPLSVPSLAAKLNVSRTPVREAVQQLIYEGIAVYTRNAGAKVDSLDADSIRAVFEVREVLDGLAAFHATAAATHKTVQQLKKMVQVQRELLDGPADQRRDSRLDLEFHTLIRETARNKPLSEALLRLDGQSHLYRSDMWSADLNRRLAVTEHERIVGAIESGDAVGARAAACAHVAGLLVRTTRM
ncbi:MULTISPECIES: GntR family transcriptional regulator [Rhodococcus]|uniref:GntR family transcriptional regulator n=1 Tax=Rhodococcus opacus RKJ300 = JCM 13270 TaxID=1165867 RepID=I0WUW1_RHOOP|nr:MULTISPECIES: GntR family transcriptional regulator [Rhodococcus]EID80177.1 GntR family transcriptional regulator [Rhodococcus opacus RKJ300 = JCM 13270]QQZ11667.1 GntR family transcriptional regulator [Rhodococcus sp. 21391]